LEKEANREKEIIRGCCRGKARSQEALYRSYYAFGMSVCLRYAPNREDSLEILNDSFMKVFENIKSYDDSRPFKSWFRRILVNTALDHYRINRKFRINHTGDEDAAETGIAPELDQKLSAKEILELFYRLPDPLRLTFNLYEVEGYSHDEIAGMLDISPGTSRSNLSRAKKMLQRLYLEMKNKQCHEAV